MCKGCGNMEHSLSAYISRRTTGELLYFLKMCMYRNQWGQYAQSVPLILEELENRKISVPKQTLSSWETFLSLTAESGEIFSC